MHLIIIFVFSVLSRILCIIGYANFENNERFHILHDPVYHTNDIRFYLLLFFLAIANQIVNVRPPFKKTNFQVQDTTKSVK